MAFVRIQTNYTATSVSDLFHFVGETERAPFSDHAVDGVSPEMCVDFALDTRFAPDHHESNLTFTNAFPIPETSPPRYCERQQLSPDNGRMHS